MEKEMKTVSNSRDIYQIPPVKCLAECLAIARVQWMVVLKVREGPRVGDGMRNECAGIPGFTRSMWSLSG